MIVVYYVRDLAYLSVYDTSTKTFVIVYFNLYESKRSGGCDFLHEDRWDYIACHYFKSEQNDKLLHSNNNINVIIYISVIGSKYK